MAWTQRVAVGAVCGFMAVLVSACGGGDASTGATPAVARVDITPSVIALEVGGTMPLHATARAIDGAILDAPVRWTSSDAAVASVAADGMVSGRQPGTATVTAVAGSARASAAVEVSAVRLTLTTPAASLYAGDTLRLAATVSGAVNTAVSFRSSNAAAATVDSTGLVRTLEPGTLSLVAVARADTTVRATVTLTIQDSYAELAALGDRALRLPNIVLPADAPATKSAIGRQQTLRTSAAEFGQTLAAATPNERHLLAAYYAPNRAAILRVFTDLESLTSAGAAAGAASVLATRTPAAVKSPSNSRVSAQTTLPPRRV